MLVRRVPRPSLRPFVELLWASDETANPAPRRAARERVLPSGAAHVAIRLADPLRLFDGMSDSEGRTVGHAVLAGPRATFYERDVSAPARCVGAQLRPGAMRLLVDVPADELSGRHTPLGDLWGAAASGVRERLLETPNLERQLDVVETMLAARLPRVRGLHPAIAHALERFTECTEVGAIVAESGLCHRRFIAMFRAAVGLPPKLYCRVRRFHDAVARTAREPAQSLVTLALDTGFTDQAHLNRDFRTFAGISPGSYRALAPAQPQHVPIRASRAPAHAAAPSSSAGIPAGRPRG